MTVENGGEQPATDTVLPTATEAQPEAVETTEAAEVEAAQELDDDGNPVAGDETEELEWDGKKWVLPKDAAAILKPALMMRADYTRKTQEVADLRRALEAQEDGLKGRADAAKTVQTEAVRVAALDDRLAEYEKVDWNTLFNTNPDLWHQHRFAREQLKEQRDTAARTLETKQGELRDTANREYGNRVAKAQAELPKLIKEWTPELDVKLAQFGTGLGLTSQEIAQATIQNPVFAKILHIAFQADEAAKKLKSTQTFQASQAAKPVTRVGGNSGSATRKTTDASGDGLSTEEWAKRENERVAKLRAAR